MIRKLMSLIIVAALVFAQSTAYAAYGVDVTKGPYVAKATPSGTATASLDVTFRDVATKTDAGTNELTWSGVNLADGWKISARSLKVVYFSNQVGWGVQIFTDNLDTLGSGTTLIYPGDPTADPAQQPAGLIGVSNSYLVCPMALLVTTGEINQSDIQTPNEVGGPGGYFDTGYDEVTGGDVEKVWFWMKDRSSTVWNDTSNPGVIDPGEIVGTFSSTGDDYATVVETRGSSSGWVDDDPLSPTYELMLRDNSASSPIYVYFAADFTNATELQEYKTETLTLEIYHE